MMGIQYPMPMPTAPTPVRCPMYASYPAAYPAAHPVAYPPPPPTYNFVLPPDGLGNAKGGLLVPPVANKKSDYPPGEQHQMIVDSAAENKSVHIEKTKRCRVSKPDYPPGEQQQMIADSAAEKKAVQRERTKRCRVSKRFQLQIDSDFEPVKRKILVGGFWNL